MDRPAFNSPPETQNAAAQQQGLNQTKATTSPYISINKKPKVMAASFNSKGEAKPGLMS